MVNLFSFDMLHVAAITVIRLTLHKNVQRKENFNNEVRLCLHRFCWVLFYDVFKISDHVKSGSFYEFFSISDHVGSDFLSAPHTPTKYLKLRSCQQLGPCGVKQLVSGELEIKTMKQPCSIPCTALEFVGRHLEEPRTSPRQLAFQQRFEQCRFRIRFCIMPLQQIKGNNMRRDKIKLWGAS
jgi:hypothetical protein